jgi:hypothetical protein
VELLDRKWLEKFFYLHLGLSGGTAWQDGVIRGDSLDFRPRRPAAEYPLREPETRQARTVN